MQLNHKQLNLGSLWCMYRKLIRHKNSVNFNRENFQLMKASEFQSRESSAAESSAE